jgi:hypothetical protein
LASVQGLASLAALTIVVAACYSEPSYDHWLAVDNQSAETIYVKTFVDPTKVKYVWGVRSDRRHTVPAWGRHYLPSIEFLNGDCQVLAHASVVDNQLVISSDSTLFDSEIHVAVTTDRGQAGAATADRSGKCDGMILM